LRQLRKSITAVQGAGALALRSKSQHMPPRTMLPPRMRFPKKSGSRRRSIYLPLWNGDHRDIALRSSFAFEEQRQIDLLAHRGNVPTLLKLRLGLFECRHMVPAVDGRNLLMELRICFEMRGGR
jgi:hypothetical protein